MHQQKMKLYQIIRGEKSCFKKTVGKFRDGEDKVCITELLAHGLDPDGHDPKHAHLTLINETRGLITNNRMVNPDLREAIVEDDRDKYLQVVKNHYRNTRQIDVNDLIWLNDKTDMTFEDFERLFEELDV